MDKVIYFYNDQQTYFDFLDYAFKETDYFMLVYVNYYNKGYSKIMKSFQNRLEPYKVKTRSNPSWPGVLNTYCPNTTYKIVFYNNNPEAKSILKQVTKLSDWSAPSYPQDLAFFKKNNCWFYSVGHEKIAAIIHATDKDLDFVASKNLADIQKAFTPKDNYYDAYNEVLELL